MLMELKRPAEALKEYEQSQKREPDRFRSLYGAALAAEMSGDARAARRYYQRLVQVAGRGDPRAELTLARAYLTQ
jgi:tetratricopeptide (TPR) repeat protein